MRTHVTTTLDDVLSIVSCAEDYGHGGQIAMGFFAGLLGEQLSDEEIEAYAQSMGTAEMRAKGYGDEDVEAVREKLTRFKAKWCKS